MNRKSLIRLLMAAFFVTLLVVFVVGFFPRVAPPGGFSSVLSPLHNYFVPFVVATGAGSEHVTHVSAATVGMSSAGESTLHAISGVIGSWLGLALFVLLTIGVHLIWTIAFRGLRGFVALLERRNWRSRSSSTS